MLVQRPGKRLSQQQGEVSRRELGRQSDKRRGRWWG